MLNSSSCILNPDPTTRWRTEEITHASMRAHWFLVAAMLHLHLDLAVRRIGAEPERLGLRDVWDGKGVATLNVHRPHMLFRAIRQSGAFCGQETQEDGI